MITGRKRFPDYETYSYLIFQQKKNTYLINQVR